MIKVSISLIETSQIIVHQAKNTYTKGSLFCIYQTDGKVCKYPINNIWRIIEDYGDSGR